MSYSLVISGNSPTLTVEFNPAIYLEEDAEYVIGLVNFETFNAIPNIDELNNTIIFNDKVVLKIPEGSYELEDLNQLIRRFCIKNGIQFNLTANNNTLHTHLVSNASITFNNSTIGKLLGFTNKRLEANKEHISDHPAEIIRINSINIDCSIAEGSYLNGKPVHIIHQFFPNVAPGFKIIESPQNVIYFPVTVKTIDKITIKVIDQEGELVNFRGEVLTLRLHLKKI